MKRLYILRHATAIDRAESGEDIDRALTGEGREESELVGAFIKERGIKIDCVLCSPSARTRETWEMIAPHLGGKPRVHFPERLYGATEDALLAEIYAAPAKCDGILLVGHNPGLVDFARALCNREESKPKALERLDRKFPKGALASFKFDVDRWDEIALGAGRLTLFRTPKDLREDEED
jgi:phosphohistidine phosphatase